MKRSYRILPTYTGDVSGVCSALYELGGMVVMHDPSGCNSTYNTHDETRWYDRDSLIYISGLSEMDAILGNDEKFVRDVTRAAAELSPRFIALASSPIPYMNGTDFPGLSRLIEQQTGTPTFFVPTNGMHDYVPGAGRALAEIADRFVRQPSQRRRHSLNLLGVTPLDFGAPDAAQRLRDRLASAGWKVLSCWAMGDDLDTLAQAGEASVNLVVSAVGRPAAERLHQRFGTPYVAGLPVDGFARPLFAALEQAEQTGRSQIPYLQRGREGTRPVTLIGEPVTMGSLASAIWRKRGCSTRVLCPLEQCQGLFGPLDQRTEGEEAVETALRDACAIVADPLYRPVAPQGVPFYPLAHQAFSGRCFRASMQDWMEFSIPERSETQ